MLPEGFPFHQFIIIKDIYGLNSSEKPQKLLYHAQPLTDTIDTAENIYKLCLMFDRKISSLSGHNLSRELGICRKDKYIQSSYI